jgi:hypothetical protein
MYAWQSYANFAAVATKPIADFLEQDSYNPNGNVLTQIAH